MADEPELLRAVLAAPDDDQKRLDYAQWCGTQTDPDLVARGQFIELELAALRLPSSERFDLHSITDGLLTRHARAWAAPVLALGTIIGEPRFDRGFVELVRMTARDFLDGADQLFALAPVRHLDLVEVADVVDELFASPWLEAIRSLSLDQQGLLDQHIAVLAASPRLGELRWLSIAHNEVTLAGAEALAASTRLAKLAYVHFHGNPCDPSERQSHDQGVIVDTWLPPEGEQLEARHGRIPWLYTNAQSLMDLIPDRFRVA